MKRRQPGGLGENTSASIGPAAVDETQNESRVRAVVEGKNVARDDLDSDLVVEDKALGDKRNEVRQRAYEIYLRRGQRDGLALEDWLQAEPEVSGVYRSDEAA